MQQNDLPAVRLDVAVLIVEDQHSTRLALCKLLERHGYDVHAFADAESAIGWLVTEGRNKSTEQGEAVLADLDLPGMSGDRLLAVAAKLWPEARRLLMTATSAERARRASRGVGARLLRKPFNIQQLLALLPPPSPTARPMDTPRSTEAIGGPFPNLK